jgi:D-3-phosphoglycerate dehydrogenase / 2-oxoglutarate reductase
LKVLITAPMYCSEQMKDVMDYAKSSFDEVILNPYARKMTHSEIAALWSDVDAVIAGVEEWDSAFIASAPPQLTILARNGIGYDNVDLAAAAAKGITVTVTRQANSDAVADCTFAFMLALARRLIPMNAAVHSGKWGYVVADDVFQKTIGILGFGAIGQRIARRAAGFDMKILAFDPYIPAEQFKALNTTSCTAEEIYRSADYIICTGPLTKERHHIINKESLAMMKKTAYVINTARGPLVDEAALYDALKSGTIAGAGLDVFEEEPCYKSPLFELENVVLLPHLGGHSKGATHNMGRMNIDNILAVSAGRPCANIVKA